MLNRHPLFVAILLSGLCCFSQPPIPAAEPAPQSKTFAVDTNVSRIFVKVGSASALGHPHGVEAHVKSGTLTFGGAGELVFDMASFSADTPESRNRAGLKNDKSSASDAPKVTLAMRGPDVLDVTHFPTATFHITTLAPLDHQPPGAPGMYQLDGAFTLHGMEKKLQLKAKLAPPDKTGPSKLTGAFTIKQTDYGIKPYSAVGGLAKVADELEISGDLSLTPSPK